VPPERSWQHRDPVLQHVGEDLRGSTKLKGQVDVVIPVLWHKQLYRPIAGSNLNATYKVSTG
jgi:hypothetical protein